MSDPSPSKAPSQAGGAGAVQASPAVAQQAPAAPAPVGLARFRVFSNDASALGDNWCNYPEAPLAWTPDPTIAAKPGVEGGFWMVCPPHRGYAKPLNPNRADPHRAPIAAVEKITSDLAHHLRLPVPPLTLFDRQNPPAGEPRYISISAPPFDVLVPWGDVIAAPAVYAAIAPLAVPVMSAMIAFDTWVECHDHLNHPGNLLVSAAAAVPVAADLAFIDYSYAMTHVWLGAQGFTSGWVAPMYDHQLAGQVDIGVLREVITAIRAVDDAFIHQMVNRVPTAYLSDMHKALIYNGLIHRRNELRNIVSTVHPGVV
jgi:hypothetical protein